MAERSDGPTLYPSKSCHAILIGGRTNYGQQATVLSSQQVLQCLAEPAGKNQASRAIQVQQVDKVFRLLKVRELILRQHDDIRCFRYRATQVRRAGNRP